jgi:hypothetical protein
MDLNLRNVDDELVRQLKVEAAKDGKTLRDYCVERLSGQRPVRLTVEPEPAIFIGKSEIVSEGSRVVAPQRAVTDVTRQQEAVECEPCTYMEYDGETGESYRCSLQLGHRTKHKRGAKL